MPKQLLPLRPWTATEIEELISLRAAKTPIKTIAKGIGRTYSGVQQRLHLLKKTTPAYDVQFKTRFKALVWRGTSDTVIALKLGIKTAAVRYLRTRMGLRANRSQYHTKRNVNRPWPVCFGCDVRSPIMVENGWTTLTGWSSEIVNAFGAHTTVTLCPECIALKRTKERCRGGA